MDNDKQPLGLWWLMPVLVTVLTIGMVWFGPDRLMTSLGVYLCTASGWQSGVVLQKRLQHRGRS